MTNRPLTNVDIAWRRMEDPANMMMITGVMVFATPLDFTRLQELISQRLLCFKGFQQVATRRNTAGGVYYWADDPDFDLNYHLQRLELDAPGDQLKLQELVSRMMSTQLDLRRPLWQFHLVDGYQGGSVLIARLHHCIADGIELMQVLLSLTTEDPDTFPPPPPEPEILPDGGESARSFARMRRAYRQAKQASSRLAQSGIGMLAHPEQALDLAQLGAGSLAALGRLLLLPPDPQTILKGSLDVAKLAAWSAPVSLEDIKLVGKITGGTVNDVLLTAVTGALRRYLLDHSQQVSHLNLRAVVPVNLRPIELDVDLGNRFGLVFLSLPVGVADPLERLHESKRRMDALKGTPEAMVAFGILYLMGMVPIEIQDIITFIFQTKATAVMTNVPGPREKRYLAGALLDSVMFWVPQAGHLGLGISIMSYAGRVWLGVASDEGLIPDPQAIAAAFEQEFAHLYTLATRMTAESPHQKMQAMAAMIDDAISTLDEILSDS